MEENEPKELTLDELKKQVNERIQHKRHLMWKYHTGKITIEEYEPELKNVERQINVINRLLIDKTVENRKHKEEIINKK